MQARLVHRGWGVLFALSFLGAAARGQAREVAVTILHTTDLHGQILPAQQEGAVEESGGLLRCATVIQRIRDQEPHVLLVDCGDLWVGSPESHLTRGQIVHRAVSWLRYEAWVPGNHDLDWGYEPFRQLVRRAPMPVLAANLVTRTAGVEGLQPFRVVERKGLRIALVGLTTPGLSRWLLPEQMGPLTAENSLPALRRIMPRVRAEKPDILVLLLHQGKRPFGDDFANQVEQIAATFPEFDLVLGGHTHQTVPGVKIGKVWYAQAGYQGHWVGRVDLVYDTIQRAVVRVRADLIVVGPAVEPHPELYALLQADLDRIQKRLAEKVGQTERELVASAAPPGQSPVQQLLSAALAEGTGAEIVLQGIQVEAVLPPGPITLRDVWRLAPYENRVGLCSLTAAELRAVLEENAEHLGTPRFLGVRGLTYDLNSDAPRGRRVQNMRLSDGRKLHGRKRYRVAASSYALASGGERFLLLRAFSRRPHARFELAAQDARSLLIRYLRRHCPLRFAEGQEVRLLTGSAKPLRLPSDREEAD